jgi:ribosomal protein L40E
VFDRVKLALGLIICAVGIGLARANELLLGAGSPYLTVAYIIGVILGLGGLVLVGASMRRTNESMVQCPFCFALNRIGAKTCTRCHRDLPPQDLENPPS